VADADAGRCETSGEGHVWDDRIKSVMYQLPTPSSPWIVGAYLFGSHSEYMGELSRCFNPRLAHPLLNDPLFVDPDAVAVEGPGGQA
jgi:hypothetical protein